LVVVTAAPEEPKPGVQHAEAEAVLEVTQVMVVTEESDKLLVPRALEAEAEAEAAEVL
jgi:hypothetical protein